MLTSTVYNKIFLLHTVKIDDVTALKEAYATRTGIRNMKKIMPERRLTFS
jgi:hypothetical protein